MTSRRRAQATRFTEHRVGLNHVAFGVPSGEVGRLAEALEEAHVPNSGATTNPHGPTIVTFRDPDNYQWEFFEAT